MNGTIEASDPAWINEGLSFDGNQWCSLPTALCSATFSVMVATIIGESETSVQAYWGDGGGAGSDFFFLGALPSTGGYNVVYYSNNGSLPTGKSATGWHTACLVVDNQKATIYFNGGPTAITDQPVVTTGLSLDNFNLGRCRFMGMDICRHLGKIAYFVASAGVAWTATEVVILHNYIRHELLPQSVLLPTS